MMKSSAVICIENEDEVTPGTKSCSPRSFLFQLSSSTIVTMKEKCDSRRLTHSIKTGIALVIVSLLYLLNPLYNKVGENAMWAIMTVIVVFEFSAGATLSKGLNRAIGTIAGGGLGCLVAVLADQVGTTPNSTIIIGISIFLAGATATYTRMIPSIKKRFDYAAMIFILTFNLVVVSGARADGVLQLACDRLATIGMGFAVCIFTSLLVFPLWASDQLHSSLPSHFQNLAYSIEGLLEEYVKAHNRNGEDWYQQNGSTKIDGRCKTVLYSKSSDESLANLARWEPWHGKFGVFYPWDKYLEIGEILRELAAIILSLTACLHQSSRENTPFRQPSVKEACEALGSSIAWNLRELGQSITSMTKREHQKALINPKLESALAKFGHFNLENGNADDEILTTASFVFLLRSMVEKVDSLAKEVEQLGELARFHPR